MHFTPSQEQQQLADSVQRFLAQNYSFEQRKKIVASPQGHSKEVWGKLAELGLLSLQIPEAHGGMAPAPVETLLVQQALGKALFVEPFLSAAVIAATVIREQASTGQQAEWLPALASGELLPVPAHGEARARYDLEQVTTRAMRHGGGYKLDGQKSVVLHAPAASLLLVSARTAGGPRDEAGLSLFALPAGSELPAGATLRAYQTMDGQCAADLELSSVLLPASALVGSEGTAFAAIASAVDQGVAFLCAEAVGTLSAAVEATVDYTKTRKQFGVPIARFQALQHRMADMLMHVEQARSMAIYAALKAGEGDLTERRKALSAAKVIIGQACRYVGQQAVQLHGGMGVTDELWISHAFKRLTAIELSLGDAEHHLERYVQLSRPAAPA
jgi:alkylation response protein AidB-like acyl-CoA dehydrogenase